MKKLIAILFAIIISISMIGCGNVQIIDTNFTFDKADSWRDYENSDQIQVKINGDTYLIHSANVVLIAEDN